ANATALPLLPPGPDRPSAGSRLRRLPRPASGARRSSGRRQMRFATVVAATAAGALLACAGSLHAQGVRGSAQTMMRYYEIRPLVDDTIPFGEVDARSDGTFYFEGRQVVCSTSVFCVRFLSGPKQGAAML